MFKNLPDIWVDLYTYEKIESRTFIFMKPCFFFTTEKYFLSFHVVGGFPVSLVLQSEAFL